MQIASAKMLPWAKANLNYTAQALIISTGKFGPTQVYIHITIYKYSKQIHLENI